MHHHRLWPYSNLKTPCGCEESWTLVWLQSWNVKKKAPRQTCVDMFDNVSCNRSKISKCFSSEYLLKAANDLQITAIYLTFKSYNNFIPLPGIILTPSASFHPWWCYQIHLHPRNLHMIFFTAILSHEPRYQHHRICLSKGPCLHQSVHLGATTASFSTKNMKMSREVYSQTAMSGL